MESPVAASRWANPLLIIGTRFPVAAMKACNDLRLPFVRKLTRQEIQRPHRSLHLPEEGEAHPLRHPDRDSRHLDDDRLHPECGEKNAVSSLTG